MAEEKIPSTEQIDSIPELMEQVKNVYGIDVPVDLPENHPLSSIWETPIAVTEHTSPNLRYIAEGSITDEFPFNFAESFSFKKADFKFLSPQAPDPKLEMNLRIDVLTSAPQSQDRRGIKVTVFSVPQSEEHPNGVIVKEGMTFVNEDGNPIDDDISTEKLADESVIPPEAQNTIPITR
jgi:hypothetical protein